MRGCCVKPWIHGLFVEVHAGLRALVRFGTMLRAKEQELYGTVGVNAGMSRALSAMRKSFDFEHLLTFEPSTHHIHEFIHLAKMLQPYLRKTNWPPEDDWPEVTRKWPHNDAGYRRLASQYKLFL